MAIERLEAELKAKDGFVGELQDQANSFREMVKVKDKQIEHWRENASNISTVLTKKIEELARADIRNVELQKEARRLRSDLLVFSGPEQRIKDFQLLLNNSIDREEKLELQVEELKKQKDSCVPLDVTLYGYKKFEITPKPTDQHDIQGLKCLRVVLTPQEPGCEIKLAGGREIHIDGWANKVQLGMDTPFCPHDARCKKLENTVASQERMLKGKACCEGYGTHGDAHSENCGFGDQQVEPVKIGKCEGCGKPTSAVLCQPCFLSGDYQ